jgi:ABC-2 type transport system permease protein
MGRYPVAIYPAWIRTILTWIIPVSFMTTVPTQALIGTASAWTMAGGMALAVLLFGISSFFFKRSLKRYSSASS